MFIIKNRKLLQYFLIKPKDCLRNFHHGHSLKLCNNKKAQRPAGGDRPLVALSDVFQHNNW